MSSFSEQKSQEFCEAASEGILARVQSLSVDPEVNLNWQDGHGCSPFFNACWYNHVDIVRYLLDFHGIQPRGQVDYNLANEFGLTPFSVSLSWQNEKVIEILMEDERIDVNQADRDQRTPLWIASFWGPQRFVEIFLASNREIDVLKKDEVGFQKTAAEVARERGSGDMASLIESYHRDPEGVRRQLRRELGFDVRLAGELFALVVYLSDGYLALRPESQGQREARFLSIATQLPQDLQMVLCNRTFGVAHSIVKRDHLEKGFRKHAKGF